MIRSLLFMTLLLAGNLFAQNCPAGCTSVNFPPYSQVQIIACIEEEVSLGKQSVFWGAKNLTNDKLQIKFIKVVYTKCGNILRDDADTYLNPGEFVGGTTFSGEITFETQVWKEDCNMPKYRIEKVLYENLTVKNISQEEREKAAAIKAEEEKRLADLQQEKDQQDALIKQKAQQESTARQQKDEFTTKKNNLEGSKKVSEINKGQATYVESDAERQKRERRESQQKANDSENALAVDMGGAFMGVGSALSESSMDGEWGEDMPLRIRGALGACYQNIPLTRNYYGQDFEYASESSSTDPICFGGEIFADFFGDAIVGVGINPFFYYGLLAFSDSKGSMTDYGGYTYLKFGRDLQLRLKAGYEARKGKEDYDVANMGINGNTSGEYDYYTIKYGASLKYTYIEMAGFRENVSFLKDINAEIYSYELVLDVDVARFWIRYAPNYPIAGVVAYPGQYKKDKQDLFQLGFAWMFGIGKID